MAEHDAEHKLAEARRHATEELHKQGTPEYDARAHQRAVEAERKAAEEARGACAPGGGARAKVRSVPAGMYLDVEINPDATSRRLHASPHRGLGPPHEPRPTRLKERL